jgi:hypothetical protein
MVLGKLFHLIPGQLYFGYKGCLISMGLGVSQEY